MSSQFHTTVNIILSMRRNKTGHNTKHTTLSSNKRNIFCLAQDSLIAGHVGQNHNSLKVYA